MENIELEDAEKFITEMDPRFAAMVLADVAVDDAVDILQELTKDQIASFLAIMNPKYANEIKTLLHYEDKTAGSIMTTEIVSFLETQTMKQTLHKMKTLLHYEDKTAGNIMTTEFVSCLETQTVKQTLLEMKTLAPAADTIYYTYVLDEEDKLKGVISLRDLIVADEDERLSDLMNQ